MARGEASRGDAPVEDVLEQTGDGPGEPDGPIDLPDDVPEADAVEQATPAVDAAYVEPRDLPLEADEGDIAEQSHGVVLAEDDYR